MMTRMKNSRMGCCLMLMEEISSKSLRTICVIFSIAWDSMIRKSSASLERTLLDVAMKIGVDTGKCCDESGVTAKVMSCVCFI